MGETTLTLADSVSGLFDIAGNALEMITGNSVMFTMFCAGLVFTGIGIVKALKR